MTSIPYAQFLGLALPQVCLVIAAFVALTVDLFLQRRPLHLRFAVAVTIATIGCIAAAMRLLINHDAQYLMQGMWVADGLTAHIQIALLMLTVATLLLSTDAVSTRHVGEYVLLILLATVGMMFMINSRDVMVTFVSIELLSLSLYTLAGFDKARATSAEAALKYFLFGGVSAAFLLYGFSLVYGLTHATDYAEIARALSVGGLTPMLALALIAIMIGFGFKVAAAPMHFWAPDVYEGAPTAVSGFIASSSKVASFFAFFILMGACFSASAGSAEWLDARAGWVAILAVFAALSMLVGNLGALMQGSVRRMLAYSAVANTGYMLIGLVAHTQQGLTAVMYYVVTYSLSTIGAFAVIGVIEADTGTDKLAGFNGLSRRSPVLSACLLVFFLSQIGIPPLAGFFGKFFIFVSALRGQHTAAGLLWLVALALALSAVSLYYYLQVLKRVYIHEASETYEAVRVSASTMIVVILLAAGVVAAGCFPETLLRWFTAS